jgi:carboxylate-amine ligase
MPDERACLAAYETLVARLPAILSLSASSPYADGEETACRSTRATRLAELPDGSVPPPLPSWAAWEHRTAGRDYTRIWWDVRPHPRLGTLEVRMPDAQPDVRRSAGLAALVQALAAAGMAEPARALLDRDDYVRHRDEAARVALPLDGLADAAEPAARSLGSWALVEELLAGPPEAERHVAIGRRDGVAALLSDLVDRSRP